MENFPLLSRLSSMENIDLSSFKKRLNADLSSTKRYLRWKWLRLSRRRFLARNFEGAPPGLKADFVSMLEDEEGADVTFVVGDRQFRAYRRVLTAGSPVLDAELVGRQMQETSAELVKIDGMEPAIFEALLHYAYTGALPDSVDGNEPLQRLLVAADRYGMHNLMAMCEWKLCKSIDAQTVPTTLALAEQHHRAKLKDACIRFQSSKIKSVLAAIKEQELPSRVTGTMARLGTRVQGRLTLLGTKATSLFLHARNSQACRDTLLFVSSWGLLLYLAIQMEHVIEEAIQLEQDSWLDNLQQMQSSISRVSWICRLAFLERNLQEFQESAWLNSDI
ncbi:BTB/POZ and MATH domain-containing protein 5-like [Aegilops tauschii subsp. strangulata]|uniref:Speckle-type POZ protein-like protein n=1 Tax=Aegilops tauschii TaxID=37682 RepID=M8CEK8_AEGTA|nr:BTB/POZ and MATH domain-containing protein 6-like [Aegilops tauschii subsp. strangulata]